MNMLNTIKTYWY